MARPNGMRKAGCRACRIFRSTISAAGSRPAPAASLPICFARDRRRETSLAFVASPLSRARQTMELVRGTLRLPPDDYALDDRLREIGYGLWEGSTLAQAQAEDPDLFARRQADKWTVSAPGGESYVSVQARMNDWYHQLNGRHRRGRPWRHRAGADGGARLRDARKRRRPGDRAGRGLRVRRWRIEEV